MFSGLERLAFSVSGLHLSAKCSVIRQVLTSLRVQSVMELPMSPAFFKAEMCSRVGISLDGLPATCEGRAIVLKQELIY